MLLKLKLKPYIVRGRTKQEVISKIQHRTFGTLVYSYGTNGDCLSKIHGDESVVYNLEKHRTKRKRDKNNKGYVVYKQGYWIAYVYKFNNTILSQFGLKVNQTFNTFKLVKR